MKTLTNCRMDKVVASVLALLMIGFVNLAQAADASPAFDHSRTGFLLKDVHRTLKCEQCHIDGIFKNTPKDCAGCHATGTRVSAKPKPINHVPTAAACDTCHISATTFLVKSYDHVGITGGCKTCHDSQSLGVVSKPVAHIPTNLPCESCHKNTSTFLSWTMDHTGIMSGCASCHTGQFPGVVSQPLGQAHIPTNGLDCGACHGTPPSMPTFFGATYTHPGVVAGTCGTCHGVQPGVKARSANHIPTLTSGSLACDDCHTSINTAGYTTFNGVLYHQNVAGTAPTAIGNCSACHTGTSPGVQGTSSYPPHTTIVPPPTAQCDSCHNATHTPAGYTSFLGATFTHPASIVSPGIPTGPLACATCHNGTYAQTFAQPHVSVNTSTTSCASCHTTALATMSWLGATFIHTSSIVSPSASATGPNACGTCHNGTLAATYVQPHVTVPPATTCDSCHTTALATLSWLGATFNHTAAGISSIKAISGTNQCASCHNGTNAQTWVAPHVATNASTACDACHTTAMSTYSWLGATFDHAAAGITSTKATTGSNQCASCHNGTAAQTWVPPHVNTTSSTACDSCHTTALASYSWLGASFNHAAASPAIVSPGPTGTAQPACAACHNGTNAATFVPPHLTVNTATTSCDSCHTTALATQSWLGATFNHPSGLGGTVGTTGAGPSCVSCHNGTNAQTWVAPHITTTTSTACESCHTTALSTQSWLGATFNHAAATPTIVSPGPTGTTAPACAACHNGTQAQTYVQPHVTVNTTTTTCASCHTTALSTYSWLGAVFVHPSSVISPSANGTDANACATCHNGVTAATYVAPHAGLYATAPMSATVKCDDCHTNALTSLSWTGMSMTMAGVVGTGTFVHTDITGYSTGTACATCHSGTYAQGKPATHMVTAAACNSCHTTALANLSWLGAVGVDHTAATLTAGTVTVTQPIAGKCAQCHNGTIANGLSAGHIPVGSLSCDNSGCHVVGTASSFAPGLMGATQHTGIVGTVPLCSTCHNGSYASQGLNLGGAVGMVTNHIPTTSITPGLDCTTCHKNGFVNIAGAAGWVTVYGQMNHNGAQGGGSGGYCVTCHLSGTTYLVPSSFSRKNHNGSSTAKDCSSSSCHKPLGKTGSCGVIGVGNLLG